MSHVSSPARQSVTLRQAHPAGGQWHWLRLPFLQGKANSTFLQREFFRGFAKYLRAPLFWHRHMHIETPPWHTDANAGSCSQPEPFQALQVGGKTEHWWGCRVSRGTSGDTTGDTATKPSASCCGAVSEGPTGAAAKTLPWRSAELWWSKALKQKLHRLQTQASSVRWLQRGGRQQLPWEGADNIYEQIIYMHCGAKQKYLCATQLQLQRDEQRSSIGPRAPARLCDPHCGSWRGCRSAVTSGLDLHLRIRGSGNSQGEDGASCC